MSLTQGKDGYYHTYVSYEGKRYHVTGKSEAEAYQRVGQLKSELKNGTRKQKIGTTVSDFADSWLEIYRNSGSSNDERYTQIVNNIIKPTIGNRKISSITERDLQKLLNDNSHYSKSSLSKIRLTLKQIFKKAQKNHLILDDPSEDLQLPKCSEGTHRAITSAERKMILETAKTHRAGIYVKIMLYCGLRPAEVDALQWDCIDFEEHLIHVKRAVKHGTAEIGLPKSKAGIRIIPVPEMLLHDLIDAKEKSTSLFVVTNESGDHHTSASRNRMWRSFVRQMNIDNGATVYRNRIIESVVADDLTLYCLRHTYCSDLQAAGVPLNVAKILMGHEDISVTANIYTHTTLNETKTAVKELDKYLEKVQDKPKSNIIQFPFGRTAK